LANPAALTRLASASAGAATGHCSTGGVRRKAQLGRRPRPPSEAALQAALTQFNRQLADLQTWASAAEGDAQQVLAQSVILQDVALHLSFHVGEVVLMRRLQGTYPLPAHMQEFLQP
jgi:multidrug efflux pump subunit AcrA (membrane-fusion protein)